MLRNRLLKGMIGMMGRGSAKKIISSLFSLLNKNTITPEIGTHTSFTAGAGFVKNSDGFYQALPTNCAKFEGARYVENLVHLTNRNSEDLTVGWAASGVTILDATSLITTGVNGNISTGGLSHIFDAGDVITMRFKGYADDPLAKMRLNVSETGQGNRISTYETLGTSEVVFTHNVTANGSGTNSNIYIQCDISGVTIVITEIQFEVKRSYPSADKVIPSEYVSANVETTPFHGCGVDGVKAFTTELANTVASNIVTEGTGADLTGLIGQLYEPAATNLSPNSREIDVWSSAGTTPTEVYSVNGIDNGASKAITIGDDDGATSYERKQKTITVANDSLIHTFSLFVLKDTDTTRFPEFALELSGGTFQGAYIQLNTQTGASSIRTVTGTATVDVKDEGLWWRFTATLTNNTSGNTLFTCKIFPAMTTTWNVIESSATGEITVDAAQIEKTAYVSSFIETSGSTVTRTHSLHQSDWPTSTNDNFKLKFTYTHRTQMDKNGYIIGVGTGINLLRMYIFNVTEKLVLQTTIGGTPLSAASDTPLVEGSTYNIEVRSTNGVHTFYIDDVLQTTSNNHGAAFGWSDPETLYLGTDQSGNFSQPCVFSTVSVEDL